jgi:P4 family phage/plasmid primase-like protien
MNILEQPVNVENMIEFKDFSQDFQNSYFNNSKQFNNSKKHIERLETNKFLKKYLSSKGTNIFEVYHSDTKLKPFYDIDKGFETEKEFNDNHEYLKNQIMNYLGKMYPFGSLAISEAHGWKAKNETKDKKTREIKHYAMSYHIIVNNYETNIKELKEMNEAWDIYNKYDYVDKSVYRTYGLMKCIFASKPWEQRFKKIECNKNPLHHLIQSNKQTNTGFNKLQFPEGFIKKIPKVEKPEIPEKETSPKSECFEKKNTLNKNIQNPKNENNKYPEKTFSQVIQTLFNVKNKWLHYKDIIDVGMAFFNTCYEMDELPSGRIIIAQWIKNGTKIWTSRPDRSVADWNTRILKEWDYWVKRQNIPNTKLTYGSLDRWARESQLAEAVPNEKYKELSKKNKQYLDLIPCNKDTSYKIGSILKKLGCNIEVWNEWCKQDETYNIDDNKFKWLDIEKYNYNEKTLYYLSFEYNKEKTLYLKNSLYDKLVVKYMKNQTEYEMARLIRNYIGNIYCIEAEGTKKTFIIPNDCNTWERKNKAEIGKYLSEEIHNIFSSKSYEIHLQIEKVEKELEEKLLKIDNEELEEKDEKKLKQAIRKKYEGKIKILSDEKKRYHVTAIKLQTQSSKNNFISALSDNTYEKGIIDKLDETNLYLINFNNGAYDLKNDKFIIPEADDFVSKTTGYDFTPEVDEDIRKELFELINKVYKDETDETTELRDYNLKLIASCLCGVNKYEGFYVLTGTGSNGKSLIDSLNAMVFGEYYDVIDKSFFTTQKKSSGTADPELAGKKGVRMMVSSECEKTEEFQANKLKILSGNDNISTRGLFQEQFKFIPQFTIFIQSNGCPNLSQVDKGVKRRFRLIEHPTQFVSNPEADNRYQEKKDVT